jgi:hypothetical protein
MTLAGPASTSPLGRVRPIPARVRAQGGPPAPAPLPRDKALPRDRAQPQVSSRNASPARLALATRSAFRLTASRKPAPGGAIPRPTQSAVAAAACLKRGLQSPGMAGPPTHSPATRLNRARLAHPPQPELQP